MIRASLILGLCLIGCSGKGGDEAKAPVSRAPATETPPPTLVITRLSVVDETPAERRPVQVPVAEMESAWRTALTGVGFTFGEKRSDVVAIRVDARAVYGLTRGDGLLATVEPARAEVRWAVRARLRAPGAEGRDNAWFEGAAGGDFKGDAAALKAALIAHLAGAIKAPATGLKARAELMALTPVQLLARLDSGDAGVRLAAVDRLGALRASSAVEGLIALSRRETERDIKLRIIGALAEIGDDSAAKALISLANPRDREMLRAVVEALSVVGGERVSDFLDILSAHDAPDVREMVETARARLARKAKRK